MSLTVLITEWLERLTCKEGSLAQFPANGSHSKLEPHGVLIAYLSKMSTYIKILK